MGSLFESAGTPVEVAGVERNKLYQLYAALATMVDRLNSPLVRRAGVIPWGAPVLSFGDLGSARLATIGINPSNREFVDECGEELQGIRRRFHTLNSLGISSWSEVDVRHLRVVLESCRSYFHGNPYNRWFRRLDHVIAGADASYYGGSGTACHIDLIPYATKAKWATLDPSQRAASLRLGGDSLRVLLAAASVQVVVLNGRGVVEHFTAITGCRLVKRQMPGWSLRRASGGCVPGFSYVGRTERLAGVPLDRRLLIVGFNHNIQSSYGVTREVVEGIRMWLSEIVEEMQV